MNPSFHKSLIALIAVAIATVLSGCTTVRETFPGHDPDQVWTALQAAANSPDYSIGDPADRWKVRENQVWVDNEGARIEIYRKLAREIYQMDAKPLHEERTWKLTVNMIEREPPTVEFTSRQAGVPAHAWDEATRYFDEVREILGEPAEIQPAPIEVIEPAAE